MAERKALTPEEIIAAARRERALKETTYRERALKLFVHVCARCGRELSGKRLRELTVHHKDHNHDNNPPDGSNWELLCVYCHDNEHQKQIEADRGYTDAGATKTGGASHSPFAGLKSMLAAGGKSE